MNAQVATQQQDFIGAIRNLFAPYFPDARSIEVYRSVLAQFGPQPSCASAAASRLLMPTHRLISYAHSLASVGLLKESVIPLHDHHGRECGSRHEYALTN